MLVEGGRIKAIAPSIALEDASVLDATSCIVAPGFIDIHSHADFTVLAFPSAESAVRQGVTTIVNGNCGGGVAPALPKNDVRRVAFAYNPRWGLEISWRSFGEYLAHIRNVAINVATLVPHGAIRNAVMGLEARPPDGSELKAMKALLDESLEAGGIGMSTGLEYQPGCYADLGEIAELAAIVAARDGLYATHMRNRAESFGAATREALEVGLRSGARVQLSHVAPRPYAPESEVRSAFDAIEEAVADKRPVWVDTFPETWGPGNLADLFPSAVTQGVARDVLMRLRDSHVRREIQAYFDAKQNFLIRGDGYENVYISSTPTSYEAVGRSLPDLAAENKKTVAEWACDALLEAGDLFMSVGIRHVYATENDLRAVLKMPCCSLGSDGIVIAGEDRDCPYPWNASTYGYAPRTLEYYVREEGVISLEESIRRLSALPAEALGLSDRGLLREGAWADVVVFEPENVHDRTTPTCAARYPSGVRDVLVNGTPVVFEGRTTGATPGRVLTR